MLGSILPGIMAAIRSRIVRSYDLPCILSDLIISNSVNVPRRLYVIGNGFDLYHGIASRYSDFGLFVKHHNPEVARMAEKYLGLDDDSWFELEQRLAAFDADGLVDEASAFLLPYGSDEWSDASHHDYSFEIEQVVAALSKNLQTEFGEWVRQLHIPAADSIGSKLLPIDQNQIFLNFNYTPSLQRIYGVRDSRIMYIHGSSTEPNDRLILGHGWQRKPEDSFLYGRDLEEVDTRELQGNQILDQYFDATFKPTARIIKENLPFFETLQNVDEVWVMGHSLESVDLPTAVQNRPG